MTGATLDRERLSKLLGMLGSEHDGEALAAARQAERLRAEAGLTWAEILLPRLPAPRRRHHHVETFADAIEFILDFEETLTPWERDFARSLRRQRTPVSTKQIAILDQLLEKVRRTQARAA
jgi:hypothetical protein